MALSDPDRELQLLAEGAALRRLARSLVGGRDGAEDLVQETMAASLQDAGDDAARRPWLVGTLRNLALFWRRSATRRAARERLAGAAATPPNGDPAAIAMQAEAMRDVAAAVHELEEPFRTVVVLRFWHALPPEAIAQRLGVPRNTVRSRLQRGIERLRARLDRDYGDRAGWLAALIPFANPFGLATASAVGAASTWTKIGVLVMTKLQTASVIVALAAVGLLTWWIGRDVPTTTTAATSHDSVAAEPASGTVATPEAGAAASPGASTVREGRVAAAPGAGLTVHGTATRDGSPRADLELLVQWFEGTETTGQPASETPVRSDHAGAFVWTGPVRGTVGTVHAVCSLAVDDAKVWCTPQVVQPGQAEVHLAVTVVALDKTLFGRVRDVGGVPIADAELSVNGWEDVVAWSDAEGRYRMKVTGPPYPLLVVKNGFRERLFDAYMPDGKLRHEFDIELEPGAMFTGRVVDEAGNAIAGALVQASGLAKRTRTDDEGRFTLGGAAQNERHGLAATKTGFQRAEQVASAGGDAIELVLRPGLALAVRVVDGDGNGLAGVRIGTLTDPFRALEPRGVTDADGRLRIVDMPAKPIDVLADKAGFVKARGTADVPQVHGEFVLVMRPGRTIAGRVIDEVGKPIVGASVHCLVTARELQQRSVGSRATTDSEGRFTIRELPPEPCSVVAHHADHRQASLDGISGTPSDLVVRMQAAASVAGRVVDGVTGAPIGAFTIVLAADHDVQPLQYVEPVKFVDSDGWWRIKHWQLDPGAPLFVEVWAEGHAPQRVPTASKIDAPRDQSVIRMFAGATVKGVVLDAQSGAPVPQVAVTLRSGDPKAADRQGIDRNSSEVPIKTRVHTDTEGRFELLSVPPGENRLELAHPDFPNRTFGPFDVAAGATLLEVQPRLTHGASLRGQVTGWPDAVGRKISAHVFDDKTIEATIAPDGTFELSGVGAGRAWLSLTNGAGSWYSRVVEVGDEDIQGILFAVPEPGTGSIRAAVIGSPNGRGSVESLDVAPGQCKTVRTFEYTAAGFVLGALPAGRYEIEVHSPGFEGAGKADVTVGDGEVAVTIDVVWR